MASLLRPKVPVEDGADAADEGSAELGHLDSAAGAPQQTVSREILESLEFRGEGCDVAATLAAERSEIEAELAHQTLDEVGPEAILGARRDAAHRGEFAREDALP